MDPQACLDEIVDLLNLNVKNGKFNSEDDRDQTVEHLKNLAEWLEKGGFPPDFEESLRKNSVF